MEKNNLQSRTDVGTGHYKSNRHGLISSNQ